MSLTPEEIVQNIRDKLNVTKNQCDEMLRELTSARDWYKQYDPNFTNLRARMNAAVDDLLLHAQAVKDAIP